MWRPNAIRTLCLSISKLWLPPDFMWQQDDFKYLEARCSQVPLKSHGELKTCMLPLSIGIVPKLPIDWVSSYLSQSLCLKDAILWLVWPSCVLPMELGICLNFAWTTGIETGEGYSRGKWQSKTNNPTNTTAKQKCPPYNLVYPSISRRNPLNWERKIASWIHVLALS